VVKPPQQKITENSSCTNQEHQHWKKSLQELDQEYFDVYISQAEASQSALDRLEQDEVFLIEELHQADRCQTVGRTPQIVPGSAFD